MDECHDILVWLRAACTACGGGGAQNALPGVLHPFVPLNLPPEVHHYVVTKVQDDLPRLAGCRRSGGSGSHNLYTPRSTASPYRAMGCRPDRGTGPDGSGWFSDREQKSMVDAYKETYMTLLLVLR